MYHEYMHTSWKNPLARLCIPPVYAAREASTSWTIYSPVSLAGNDIDPLVASLVAVGWALAGAFVGSLAGHKWVKYRAPWSILVVTAGGGLMMLATHIGLPYWLKDAITDSALLTPQDPAAPLFSLIMVIIVGTAVYTTRESLDLPVAPRKNLRTTSLAKKAMNVSPFNFLKNRSKKTVGESSQQHQLPEKQSVADKPVQYRRPVRVPHHSELPEWEPPKDESGLIMLEID